MEINKTFKIKEKYFNAILQLDKSYELRHESVAPNSIVKLECENGRYLIFKSGECCIFRKKSREYYINQNKIVQDYEFVCERNNKAWYYSLSNPTLAPWTIYNKWFDIFCWEYLNQAPTYLIEIAEILEVK